MPIYEYACRKCNHTLDVLQKMADDPLVECPECGEAELRRLISAPRFRLKGQGWYETDFKKDRQRNLLSPDGEPPKDKAKDKEGQTAKTEAKSNGDGKTAQPAKASDTKTASKTAAE